MQEDMNCAILDGEDLLCCSATGDGKSAAFSVPILVLTEYNAHPALYPAGLRTRLNPVGIVITPTKGLASNIVLELQRMNIRAFAYCKESLADARRQGQNLADEIKKCEHWQVVCVDPEHLKTKNWRDISDFPAFRDNLLYNAVDEVHLIKLWGVGFRVDFQDIGLFARGRLPVSTSIVGLTATLAPGKDTKDVCESLGMFDGQFHMFRRTNERPNIHLSLQTLSHGLTGYEFPDLLPFLRSGRKMIVHFHSLPMLFRCYVYIWRLHGSSADKMRRTRMYHSLCPPEYNEETIRLIDEDPHCQIILATIAFANGINAKSILNSISLGFSSSLDIVWQEKGRAGRASGTEARGVVLVQQSTLTLAKKFINSQGTPATTKPTKGKGKRKPEAMNLTKARFLTEPDCLNAFLNIHYQNPPLEVTRLDCIAANRPLPCSLCLARTEKTLKFPAPPSTPKFPALKSSSKTGTRAKLSKKLKLTRKERESASDELLSFRNSLRWQEHKRGNFTHHSQGMFLPPTIQTVLLDQLLSISSLSSLQTIVSSWRHCATHSPALYDTIRDIQATVNEGR
ncbi:P-loop containing nucleoside triphosphate hydrolase protein, partial [Mycena polygramma]